MDKETSTVRLIHYTLQEYLSRPGILPDANKTLGQTCLTYLNYDQAKGLPANNASNFGGLPFLEYSSLHWGDHAKMDLAEHAKSLALELFTRHDNYIYAALLFNQIHNYHFHPSTRHLLTGLHCASYFGIDEVVDTLIDMKGCNINQGDCWGFTPLIWAARQGNQGVLKLLLTRHDVDPDQPDDNGQTPLLWASSSGHETVVRLLLARDDVDPNSTDKSGWTPLLRASLVGVRGW